MSDELKVKDLFLLSEEEMDAVVEMMLEIFKKSETMYDCFIMSGINRDVSSFKAYVFGRLVERNEMASAFEEIRKSMR